jgi:hypothetical protein
VKILKNNFLKLCLKNFREDHNAGCDEQNGEVEEIWNGNERDRLGLFSREILIVVIWSPQSGFCEI